MENHDKRKTTTTIAGIMKKCNSQSQQQTHNNTNNNKRELPHSPLRFESPLRSDEPLPPETPPQTPSPVSSPDNYDYSKAIVPVDNKYFLTQSPHSDDDKNKTSSVENTTNLKAEKVNVKVKSHGVMFSRSVREQQQQSPAVTTSIGGGGGEDGRGERRAVVRRSRTEETVHRVALGLRVAEVVLCLISFSVMAADKTQGWSGDSFDRYKEYRYCLSVNVIAFVYAGFQAFDLAYHLITEKHVIQHRLCYHFDFFMDQILAYLLISASSSSATRVDDWQTNWGKDEFTKMASASISMSFLAFAAFAFSSLISGHNLCNRHVM